MRLSGSGSNSQLLCTALSAIFFGLFIDECMACTIACRLTCTAGVQVTVEAEGVGQW